MFIKIKDIILNTDKIESLRKDVDTSYVNRPWVVMCNEKVIFHGTEEERDKFFDNLWQEIEKIKR